MQALGLIGKYQKKKKEKLKSSNYHTDNFTLDHH